MPFLITPGEPQSIARTVQSSTSSSSNFWSPTCALQCCECPLAEKCTFRGGRPRSTKTTLIRCSSFSPRSLTQRSPSNTYISLSSQHENYWSCWECHSRHWRYPQAVDKKLNEANDSMVFWCQKKFIRSSFVFEHQSRLSIARTKKNERRWWQCYSKGDDDFDLSRYSLLIPVKHVSNPLELWLYIHTHQSIDWKKRKEKKRTDGTSSIAWSRQDA